MGSCVSTRKGFEGNRSNGSKKKVAHHSSITNSRITNPKRKKRVLSRSSHRSLDNCTSSQNNKSCSFRDRSSNINPTFQGSSEEAFFDSTTRFDSDGEEDFQSVPDVEAKHPVSHHDMPSSVEDHGCRENGLLDNCLPCLTTTTVDSIEKRRSLVSSPTSAKKKAVLKHSFKGKDGHPSSILSAKMILHRPAAGCQVRFSPVEKKLMDTWSNVEPHTFRIRGTHFFRDKKKEFAPNHAAYYPFGVDVFLSPRKIEHIARFVDLPVVNSATGFPPILIVNAQIPLYPATLFQSESDGDGMNIVMYYKINECFAKELPPVFQESLRKLMHDEVEKVKGFPMDSIAPFRERLKILGRLANVDDLHLSATEKKLINAYNEKPVLSRPQHDFFSGENYFEIDLDMHRFSYISRKGFEAFLDRMRMCILDFGLTIQGNKAEEVPEHILCCIQLNGIDYLNYQQLEIGQQPSWN